MYTYTCFHIYWYLYMYIYSCICVNVYSYIFIFICTCIYIYIYTYIHIYIYVCIHAYINVYMHFSPRYLCAYIDCVHVINMCLPSLSQITHEQPRTHTHSNMHSYTQPFKYTVIHTCKQAYVRTHSKLSRCTPAFTYVTGYLHLYGTNTQCTRTRALHHPSVCSIVWQAHIQEWTQRYTKKYQRRSAARTHCTTCKKLSSCCADLISSIWSLTKSRHSNSIIALKLTVWQSQGQSGVGD